MTSDSSNGMRVLHDSRSSVGSDPKKSLSCRGLYQYFSLWRGVAQRKEPQFDEATHVEWKSACVVKVHRIDHQVCSWRSLVTCSFSVVHLALGFLMFHSKAGKVAHISHENARQFGTSHKFQVGEVSEGNV